MAVGNKIDVEHIFTFSTNVAQIYTHTHTNTHIRQQEYGATQHQLGNHYVIYHISKSPLERLQG